MATRPQPGLSRRALLLGGAGAVLLAACGGDDDSAGSTTTTLARGGSTSPDGSRFSLVQFFGQDVLRTGISQRAPFGLGDEDGVVTGEVPASLEFAVTLDGDEVVAPVAVPSYRDGLPRPYFPLTFTVETPGVYTVSVELEGQRVEAAVQVSDPGEVAIPQAGDPMVAIATPTIDDARGVNPICTREPACPLHAVALDDALAEGRPVALLISTPKFCQVSICGPVLDLLLAQQAAFPDLRMIHAEVFTDETTATTTEAVSAFGLTFEPCLFLARADGTVA
ncbi:hypothetical protein BH18ACT4_BH18ACT4_12900 [soil metagenome]